ncbi:MAG: hypothetical protein K2K13_04335 [Clostridiales bacterium]|nr:hypothetical protein [Clostridiales bacterium]
MDKKTVHIVVSVILGIAAFTIVATAISLLFDAILANDPITITEPVKNVEDTILYIKHSSIAVFCIAIPAVVCYFLTYFSKSKKVFGFISALLSLVVIAMCLGFIFDLRGIVLAYKEGANTSYSLASAYFSELGKMFISFLFPAAYFTVITVSAFRTEKSAAQPAPTAQPEQTVIATPEQGE